MIEFVPISLIIPTISGLVLAVGFVIYRHRKINLFKKALDNPNVDSISGLGIEVHKKAKKKPNE